MKKMKKRTAVTLQRRWRRYRLAMDNGRDTTRTTRNPKSTRTTTPGLESAVTPARSA
jgi:hypothetical protein